MPGKSSPAAKRKSGYFAKPKTPGGDYTGPSGKKFDLAQVQLFYAHGGKFPGQSKKSVKAGWRGAAHQRRVNHVG